MLWTCKEFALFLLALNVPAAQRLDSTSSSLQKQQIIFCGSFLGTLESLGEHRLFIIWKYSWPDTVIRGRPFIYFLTNIPRRTFICCRPLINLFSSPSTLPILYSATSRFSTFMCIFDVFDINSTISLNNFESLAME